MCRGCEERTAAAKRIFLPLLLLLWWGNEVEQVEETRACRSPSCQFLRELEIWRGSRVRGGGVLGPLGCLEKQNLSLIKEEWRGDTWKWHSPSLCLPPPSVLEMLCMTATATQLAGSPLSPPVSRPLSSFAWGRISMLQRFGRYTYNI